MKQWYKQKTTWSAISTILLCVAGVVSGKASVDVAIGIASISITQIFQRQAGGRKNED